MEKVIRYSWAKPGDNGKQCSVSLTSLMVDHSYQRHEVSEANTLKIARDFNWVAFGSIVVMRRDNGSLYIVDGQQRVSAAKSRGDIKSVPCIMFKSDGRDHEARAFVALNVNRKNVRALDKYNANVSAGVLPEKDIDHWIQSIDMVVDNGTTANSIGFAFVLVNTWQYDVEACKTAIECQRKINNGELMHSDIHKGLFWLAHSGVDVLGHVDKIMSLGGRVVLLQKIKAYCIESGTRGEKACARGILGVINHRRRKSKITV